MDADRPQPGPDGGAEPLLGVAMVIANVATISLFFAVGQPWGTINDVVSVLLALTFLLPVLAYRLIERRAGLSAAAALVALIGVTRAIASTAVSVVVALGLVKFGAIYPLALLAFGIIGVWLVLVGIALVGQTGWGVGFGRRLSGSQGPI